MSDKSKIEWTDATWNPIRGCTKVSPGCTHCYAETFAERWRGIKGHPFEHGFDPQLVLPKMNEPLNWKKPRRIFVNSMSDLFHEIAPDEYIKEVCDVMLHANWHTYQILTKRPERMQRLLITKLREAAKAPHIWWGVSVENQKHGLPRIEWLRHAWPTNRFLSVEPLLEDLGDIDLAGINWVIIGGESGPGARPCNARWIEAVSDACDETDIPVFIKQLGAKSYYGADTSWEQTAKPDIRFDFKHSKGGNPNEWPLHLRRREFPPMPWLGDLLSPKEEKP